MRNHKQLVVPTTTTTTPSSSKNNSKQQEQQPHLSGAYIRSLVKQLSSSSTTRSKDHTTMGTRPPHGGHPQPSDHQEQQAPPQPQPHKKQVRRRLHTTRPYQERLLNMAEARREIVTALKIHRASMRQAKEQQQLLQQQQQQQQDQFQVQVVQEQSQAAARSASSAAMSYANSFPDHYLYNSSPFAHLTATSTTSYSSPLPYHTPATPMACSGSGYAPLDHLLPLPAQPLGLNLSFHGFNDVVANEDANICTSTFDPPLFQPSPTSSYSVYSSPSVTMAGHDIVDMSSVAGTDNASSLAVAAAAADASLSLHRVLDDEEMAAIYSIGEQHDIEWSDTVNLVTSAWWSKILDTVEGGDAAAAPGQEVAGDGAVNTVEDGMMAQMPDWFGESLGDLGTRDNNSGSLGMDDFSEYYHHGSYGQDVALPRMDLGEIEGWDAEWFS